MEHSWHLLFKETAKAWLPSVSVQLAVERSMSRLCTAYLWLVNPRSNTFSRNTGRGPGNEASLCLPLPTCNTHTQCSLCLSICSLSSFYCQQPYPSPPKAEIWYSGRAFLCGPLYPVSSRAAAVEYLQWECQGHRHCKEKHRLVYWCAVCVCLVCILWCVCVGGGGGCSR